MIEPGSTYVVMGLLNTDSIAYATGKMIEEMGFTAEALLKEHVRDQSGEKHDIVILSHDVAEFQAKMEAYGLTDAF